MGQKTGLEATAPLRTSSTSTSSSSKAAGGAGEPLRVPLLPQEASPPAATICVTGATGYVAGPIIARLLAAGHRVRGTARDVSPHHPAVAALLALPGAAERLQLYAADLLLPGSFDEAVAGCDVVIHTASPFTLSVRRSQVRQLLLEPAVRGVENVIGAVNRSPSVRRVVLTSSIAATCSRADDHHPRRRHGKAGGLAAAAAAATAATKAGGRRVIPGTATNNRNGTDDDKLAAAALLQPDDATATAAAAPPAGPAAADLDGGCCGGTNTSRSMGGAAPGAGDGGCAAGGDAPAAAVITERHWNTSANEAYLPYSWSKTEAERRAWRLVCVLPGFVLGPCVGGGPGRCRSESVLLLRRLCEGAMWPAAPNMGLAAVDVRDVAAAHCRAALLPGASGRYLVVGGGTRMWRLTAALAALYPGGAVRRSVAVAPRGLVAALGPVMLRLGSDVVEAAWGAPPTFSTARAAADLGLASWVPLEESLRDMVEDLAAKGLVRHPLSNSSGGIGLVLGKQAAWLLTLGLCVIGLVALGAAAVLGRLRV
ncbi:hypothetical protein HYH02_005892 [Chlamydomonas schloesseri]|uniref:NAD-dependent epimerase/dehydratase domain-containing protein n=1 Tax=Chlamydomonas schloesseri TaxID=2026947 RepID=A0A835WLW2_9CHLO|nr:hypothetical protein HYH02_005892 [Chlamydomonas schloesseri]|eukprot:KAG2449145.1 hypothetical protein HYH02_005892 [Chlamydomonas schloesseri]